VAFGSDFTETWSDKSLGLKYTKGNGKLTFFVKHALEGVQSAFRNPTLKVCGNLGWECTYGYVLTSLSPVQTGSAAKDFVVSLQISHEYTALSI